MNIDNKSDVEHFRGEKFYLQQGQYLIEELKLCIKEITRRVLSFTQKNWWELRFDEWNN